MASVNQALADAGLKHWLGLQRYGTGLSRDIIRLLEAADEDLAEAITGRLDLVAARGFDTGPWTTARLQALRGDLQRINREAYEVAGKSLTDQLRSLAGFEVDFQVSTWDQAMPVNFSYLKPTAEQLKAIVEHKPLEGKVLGEWLEKIEDNRLSRMMQQLKIGLVEGEGIDKLSRRVLGASGVVRKSRRGTEALVRTMVNDVSNTARMEFYRANDSLIKGIRIIATLDGRTTAICQQMDGRVFSIDEINEGEIGSGLPLFPPYHWGCRTTTAPEVKDWDELGFGSASPDEELEDVRPYVADKRRVGDIPKADRDRLIGRTKASDNMEKWLRKQSKSFQDDLLGKTRAQSFRGGSTLQEVWSKKAVYLKGEGWTLQQVAANDDFIPDVIRLANRTPDMDPSPLGMTLLEEAQHKAAQAQAAVRAEMAAKVKTLQDEMETRALAAKAEREAMENVEFGVPSKPLEKTISVAEVQTWGSERYPWMDFKLDGMTDLVVARRAVKQFEELAQQYPQVARRLEYFGSYQGNALRSTAAKRDGLLAYVINQPGEGYVRQLNLNEWWFNDSKGMLKLVRQGIKNGQFQRGSASIEALITHEFGHLVDDYYRALHRKGLVPVVGADGTGSVATTWTRFIDKWQERVTARKVGKAWPPDASIVPSMYARENAAELVAEAFAEMRALPKAQWSKFTQEMNLVLRNLDRARWVPDEQLTFLVDLPKGGFTSARRAEILADLQRVQRANLVDDAVSPRIFAQESSPFTVQTKQILDDIGYEMFSSYEGDELLSWAAAKRLAKDEYYAKVTPKISKYTDELLGHKTRNYRAIGDTLEWGTEPSVLTIVQNPKTYAEIRYSAAVKGKIFRQKGMVPFLVDETGDKTMYVLEIPKSRGTAGRIRKWMDANGLEFRTFVEFKTKTRVLIFDDGYDITHAINSMAERYKLKGFEYAKGTGEIIGSQVSRAAAIDAYQEIIDQFEAALGRSKQGLGGAGLHPGAAGPAVRELREALESRARAAQVGHEAARKAKQELAEATAAHKAEIAIIKAEAKAEAVEEALPPFKPIELKTAKDVRRFIKEEFDDAYGALTQAQQEALDYWKGFGYLDVQRAVSMSEDELRAYLKQSMRTSVKSKIDEAVKRAYEMDRVLNSIMEGSGLSRDVLLYRGLDGERARKLIELVESGARIKGQEISLSRGYVATSASMRKGREFIGRFDDRILVEVRARAGTKGFAPSFTEMLPSVDAEMEILLGKGKRYRIVGSRTTTFRGRKLHILEVEDTLPPKPVAKGLDVSDFKPARVPINDRNDYVAKLWADDAAKLSDESRAALKQYKGTSNRINGAAGGATASDIAAGKTELMRHVRGVEDAINGSALPEDMFLYRGISPGDTATMLRKVLDEDAAALVGREITLGRGFVSTSMDERVASAFTGDLMIKVKGRAGMPGFGMQSAHQIGFNEAEVLLQRGSRYRVTAVRKIDDTYPPFPGEADLPHPKFKGYEIEVEQIRPKVHGFDVSDLGDVRKRPFDPIDIEDVAGKGQARQSAWVMAQWKERFDALDDAAKIALADYKNSRRNELIQRLAAGESPTSIRAMVKARFAKTIPDPDAEVARAMRAIQKLDETIASHALGEDIVLYRGLHGQFGKELAELAHDVGDGLVGQQMSLSPGFVSTTVSEGVAKQFAMDVLKEGKSLNPVVVKIRGRRGMNAFGSEVSGGGIYSEAEITLGRGSLFEVVKVSDEALGIGGRRMRVIEVEYVGPKPPTVRAHGMAIDDLVPSDLPDHPAPFKVVDGDGWKLEKRMGGTGDNELYSYIDEAGVEKKAVVKWPRTPDAAGSAQLAEEMIANKLYEAAGVPVPKMHVISRGGRKGIVMEFVEGELISADELAQDLGKNLGRLGDVRRNFPVDAWLANWDAVGLEFDNMLVSWDGHVKRIDLGGALRLRAQGAAKGDKFGDIVGELDSMRKRGTAGETFGSIEDFYLADRIDVIFRSGMNDEMIDRIVKGASVELERAGLPPMSGVNVLAQRLKMRRQHMLRWADDIVVKKTEANDLIHLMRSNLDDKFATAKTTLLEVKHTGLDELAGVRSLAKTQLEDLREEYSDVLMKAQVMKTPTMAAKKEAAQKLDDLARKMDNVAETTRVEVIDAYGRVVDDIVEEMRDADEILNDLAAMMNGPSVPPAMQREYGKLARDSMVKPRETLAKLLQTDNMQEALAHIRLMDEEVTRTRGLLARSKAFSAKVADVAVLEEVAPLLDTARAGVRQAVDQLRDMRSAGSRLKAGSGGAFNTSQWRIYNEIQESLRALTTEAEKALKPGAATMAERREILKRLENLKKTAETFAEITEETVMGAFRTEFAAAKKASAETVAMVKKDIAPFMDDLPRRASREFQEILENAGKHIEGVEEYFGLVGKAEGLTERAVLMERLGLGIRRVSDIEEHAKMGMRALRSDTTAQIERITKARASVNKAATESVEAALAEIDDNALKLAINKRKAELAEELRPFRAALNADAEATKLAAASDFPSLVKAYKVANEAGEKARDAGDIALKFRDSLAIDTNRLQIQRKMDGLAVRLAAMPEGSKARLQGQALLEKWREVAKNNRAAANNWRNNNHGGLQAVLREQMTYGQKVDTVVKNAEFEDMWGSKGAELREKAEEKLREWEEQYRADEEQAREDGNTENDDIEDDETDAETPLGLIGEEWGQYSYDLSGYEEEALKTYKDNDAYSQLNTIARMDSVGAEDDDILDALRELDSWWDSSVSEELRVLEERRGELESIMSAIDGHSLSRSLELWRGVGGETAKRLYKTFEAGELMPGMTHSNASLVSTTLMKRNTSSFMRGAYPVRLRVLGEAGDHAFGYPSGWPLDKEAEVLFGAGQQMEILKAQFVASEVWEEHFGKPVLELWVRML